MEENKVKKKRAPTALLISCTVCGAPAPDHLHFGGHCCYSCRAFFRRTIERMAKTDIVCRTGLRTCEVSAMSKGCSACRYHKCLQVGMSVSLLQGKRKKKDSMPDLDESIPKVQKVLDMPELERIPRYKNEFHNDYRDPFSFHPDLPTTRPEDRMFVNSSPRHFTSAAGQEESSSREALASRLNDGVVGVIQGPSKLLSTTPSVIQRSPRTSVIQHAPSQHRLVPANHNIEGWNKPESLPRLESYNSSILLRYEASLMKYQADLCKERSQVLDQHARLLEQQEARSNLGETFLPPPALPIMSATVSDRHMSHQQVSQPSHTENILIKPLHHHQDIYQNKMIKSEPDNDEPSDTIEAVTNDDNTEMIDDDHVQQFLLRKDIKQFFADLIQQPASDQTIDTTSFRSNIFIEAENLLHDSPFLTLLDTTRGEVSDQAECDISQGRNIKQEEGHLTIKKERHANEEGEADKAQNKVGPIPTAHPDLKFTSTEMDWVDKIQQTMAICTKSVIREAVYQAVIDNWRGLITHREMLGILAQGKARQAYMHILIMSNLPYFQDLTSRSQQWLMKAAAGVGMELMTAVFFFGHSSDTLIGQADTCALETNFKKYIETNATYALKMPARNYETLYKSPWAETIEEEIKHKRGQQLLGESLKGKDKRIMPLLYALAVYGVSETEIKEVDIPVPDKEIIKRAQDHLGIIYKRFLKQLHGWKAASGYVLSHMYFLSLLRENASRGMKHHRTRIFTK